jgi:hypothetical protein
MTPDRCHTTSHIRYTKSEAARVAVQRGEVAIAFRCQHCGMFHVTKPAADGDIRAGEE